MGKSNSGRKLGAMSIGNFGEIYDFAVFGFSVPIIAAHFFPGTDRTAALLSTFAVYAVAFFARPVGGVLFGFIADKIGRVKVLAATVWLMSSATALIGLLPTYATLGIAAPVLLVLCRLAQGLAMGGETSGSSSYIIESAPEGRRGWWTGMTWFFSFMPNAFVAIILLVLQASVGQAAYADGIWRLPFLAGGLVGILGFWLRKNLDEPDEFKQASQQTKISNPLFAVATSGLRCMLNVILVMPILSVGAYMLLGFMYTFLVRQAHLTPTYALLANAFAISVMSVFLPIAGALSDRIGRKPVLLLGAVWVALAAYPALHIAVSGSVVSAIIGQVLLGVGVGIYGGAAFTAMPELFPTAFRTTGHALSYQLSVAVFGGTTPFIAAWLVGLSGSPVAPGVYLAVVGVIGVLTLRFVPETKGVRLRTSVGISEGDASGKVAHDLT